MREPAWSWTPDYPDTFGDLAAEVAVQVGRPMDPEQRMVLDAIFAESAPGVPTCFEVGLVAPRQNMKSAVLEIAALTDVFVLGEKLHVWTAHLFKTAQSAFEDMVGLVESNDDFRKRCRKPRTANGDEAIELLTGERIEFHARSKGGGRGLTGNKITLDEALFLAPSEVAALYPILATKPGAQVRLASSAGLVTSDVLRQTRDRGRTGSDPRLAYYEWCAPRTDCADATCTHVYGQVEGCALDRIDLLEQSNPALGRRIRMDALLAFRRAMPPLEYAREFLGWWDEPGTADAAFGPGKWEACGGLEPSGVPMSGLGVAASMDLTHGAIVASAREGQMIHIKPLHHAPGTQWTVDRALQLQKQHGVDVAIDGRGPAAVLIPALEAAGVRLRVFGTQEVLDGCAGILDLVREQHLQHANYPELDLAVAGAVKRMVGDRWAWGRKISTADISTLEAGTLAVSLASKPVRTPMAPRRIR